MATERCFNARYLNLVLLNLNKRIVPLSPPRSQRGPVMAEGSRPCWVVSGGAPQSSAALSTPREGRDPRQPRGRALAAQLELSRGTKRQRSAEEEAQKQLQRFGNGNTEKLLTERHIISLIFKQNSPSIFQNHIEHFRIIDFNREFCPKIDGAIQPKVNCFLVSIFLVRAVAMWKTILKCASFGFACFLRRSLDSAFTESPEGKGSLCRVAGPAATRGGLCSPGPGKTLLTPRGQTGLFPKPPVSGWWSL